MSYGKKPMGSQGANVSIGVPVYNGDKYLCLALDSLLAQDYENFELIICDNASEDASAEIGAQYARQDSRVRFYRNETNIGAARNFNRVFQLSSGKYFMWAAHDDLWEPSYVTKCVKYLEHDDNLVLCSSDIRFIDENGGEIDLGELRRILVEYNRLDTYSMPLRQRVSELTRVLNWYALYGVIRSDALRQTHLFRSAYGGDVMLLMELLYCGQTLILPERLFFYRLIPKAASTQMQDISGIAPPGSELRPYTQLAVQLLETIENAALSSDVRADLREDLLNNVSYKNARWANQIIAENPTMIEGTDLYLADVAVRALLTPEPAPQRTGA
jgi:hypothetical protein